MRIIGGEARGRRIKSPPGRVRPTSDRVREALFNILRERIEGAVFLDLFAGSGAVGLEALSRGASSVVFVEDNPSRVKALKSHVIEFGWSERATIARVDAERFLDGATSPFDIVFVDPPYHTGQMEGIIPQLLSSRAFGPDTLLILEHPKSARVEAGKNELEAIKAYRYGDTMLSLFRRALSNPHAGLVGDS